MGSTLEHAINGVQFKRPQSHDLMISLLDGMGAEVERVIINDVAESTFCSFGCLDNELGRKL